MRYAAAYVLATIAGNANPDVATIAKILGSVGVESDNAKAQKVVDALKGKNLEQVIAEGTKKLSSLPVGGAAAPAAAAPAAGAKAAAKEEPKKEEKKKPESDDEGDDMVGFWIFLNRFFYLSLRRVLVYLIKLNKIQQKSSLNIHQTNNHIAIDRTC